LQANFDSTLVSLPETTTEAELLEQDKELNSDDELDGYIVQLPSETYRRAKDSDGY
jgi:methylenetetrahydrofolate dehydrogenase (NADP+)/methenyltetrahydrofolate cyclohydrolase